MRVWDTFSPRFPFRTYDHDIGSAVTAVAIGDQSGCFASGAEDGSIGLWIFSSVPGDLKEQPTDDGDGNDNDDDIDDDGVRAAGEGSGEGGTANDSRFLCLLKGGRPGILGGLTATPTEDFDDMYREMGSGTMSTNSSKSGLSV